MARMLASSSGTYSSEVEMKTLLLILLLLCFPFVGLAQTTSIPAQAIIVNKQTGTTYTVANVDRARLVTLTNGSAIAVTLPRFSNGWYVWVENRGVGTVTITPSSGTIDGAGTLTLTTNQGVLLACDGTNYFTGARGKEVAGGDVVGPGSSTDNAAVRFDGTTGKFIQNSAVTIDDNGSVVVPSGQSVQSPIFKSAATDPADAGAIRLGNNEFIEWEKATPGTDWTFGVNGTDILTTNAPMSAPSLTLTTTPLAIGSGGTGTSSTLTGLVRGSASAMTAAEISGDGTTSGSNVLTLVSTIVAGGPQGSATVVPIISYDAKGRLTAVTTATIAPPFSAITSTPTTLVGYGITNGQIGPLTGDVTTSGAAASLKSTGTAGTYRSVTFDAQGRETSGTNPTTFSGYGLSDTSANLRAALTDELGTGAALFDGATPTGFVCTNCSGTAAGLTVGSATTATTATNATNTAITDDTATNATMYPTWVTTASSNQAQKVSSTKLTFNPSTGGLVATLVNGLTITNNGTNTLNITAGKTITASDNATISQDYSTAGTPQFAGVGIGTASGATGLTISAAAALILATSSTSTNRGFYKMSNGSGNAYLGVESSVGGGILAGTTAYATVIGNDVAFPLQFSTNGGVRMSIASGGGITLSTNLTNAAGTPGSLCYNTATFEMTKNNALTCTVSHPKYKSNITSLNHGLDVLSQITPMEFSYKDNPNRLRWGFLSTQLQGVDRKLGDGYDVKGEAQSIDIPAILAINTKALQELNAKVKRLEHEKTTLHFIRRRPVHRHARAN